MSQTLPTRHQHTSSLGTTNSGDENFPQTTVSTMPRRSSLGTIAAKAKTEVTANHKGFYFYFKNVYLFLFLFLWSINFRLYSC